MEYTLPLAKLEGQVIAMKGSTAYDETNSAAKAISTLGGELFSIEEINLPTIENPRYLVIVDKLDPTSCHQIIFIIFGVVNCPNQTGQFQVDLRIF